jgi:TrmH family RNA methyltransferase
MNMQILSVQNPRVKQWAQLLEKKGRDKQGKFIVEGFHLVKEALTSDADVECVVYDMDHGIPEEIRTESLQATDGRMDWIEVSAAVMAKCTDTVTPQGVFAVIRKASLPAEQLLHDMHSLVIVVDGVQDPGNLGTILRSADAVAASGVLIGEGTVDLYNPKTIRSTMGSIFHLPVVQGHLPSVLEEAEAAGVQIVSTSLQTDHYCYDLDMTGATWFIVGNEGKGVSPEVSRHATRLVKIPIPGKAESLNVAMATTVLLYEALRQRKYT